MAIGLLKGKFRWLNGKFRWLNFLEMYNILEKPYIICPACALHNFILKRSDVDMDAIDHEQAGGDVENESVLLQLPANNGYRTHTFPSQSTFWEVKISLSQHYYIFKISFSCTFNVNFKNLAE